MATQVIDTVVEEETPTESKMTLDELKAWILAQGTEELDLFARNCWMAAS